MAQRSKYLEAGYGNGGIPPMEQFDKLAEKIGNSLKNLEYTRDMLRQLAETEKKSAKEISLILNKKNKQLRFSVVDQAIQNYWKKIESQRRHFSEALLTKIVSPLDGYINNARTTRKQLQKENSKIKKSFIDIEKERAKQKQICEKEWKKLEDQINKNDINKKANKMGKIKDLKPLQDKTSKAFKKMEGLTLSLNELEQSNHKTACKIGRLLHESQKFAAQRLSIHYNTSVITKKYLEEFINKNKSIVQSKAPPLNDILWRWLSYPQNHSNRLPCTHEEIYKKHSIAQRFERRVESDYQESQFLEKPKVHKSRSQKQSPSQQPPPPKTEQQHEGKKDKKQKKTKKKDKKKSTKPDTPSSPKTQAPSIPAGDDNWDVQFGDDNGAPPAFDNNNTADFPSTGNAMSDEDFFGGSGGFDDDNQKQNDVQKKNNDDDMFSNGGFNDDIFSEAANTKPIAVEKKEEKKEKNLIEKHKEEIKESNGFDHGFDDNAFDFGNNADLDIAKDNEQTAGADAGDDAGFGDAGGWDTNFGDDTFAVDDAQKNKKEDDNVDALFDQSEVDQTVFGDSAFNNNTKTDDDNNNKTGNDFGFENGDDFAITFDDDKNNKTTKKEQTPPPPANLNDDDNLFGGGDDFEFKMETNGAGNDDTKFGDMAFGDDDDDDDAFGDNGIDASVFDVDVNTFSTTKTTKKRKSKIKKKKKAKQQESELTSIPQPIVSFDAEPTPQPNVTDQPPDEIEEDNPFGDDPFNGGDDANNDDDDDDDDIGADNPFAVFDEPETSNNDNNDDPFG